jgi:hypothetical protein
MSELIEYRVRPVTRFIVTRYERNDKMGSVGGCGRGEYDNYDTAFEVAYALAKADHERKGWPLDDERIQYPQHDELGGATPDEVREYRRSVIGQRAGPIVDGPDRFPLRD